MLIKKSRSCLYVCAAVVALQATAHAAASQAEQAMIFLSKSATVDSKCNFLSAANHNSLTALLARAELSLAQSASATTAKAARAQGRLQGANAACNDAARAETTDILNAAQMAAAQAPATTPTPTPVKSAQSVPKLKPKQVAQVALTAQPKKPISAQPTKLQSYAALTQKYYLVRRCGSISAQAINVLYQNVVALHHQSLQAFGRNAVAATMHRSEAAAEATSCS
jgi:hypothetical protein